MNGYPTRHALSVTLAVLTALIANHYLAHSQEGWIILTTFLVSQTTRGTPLKQSLHYAVLIILSLLFSSALSLYVINPVTIYFIVSFILIVSSYVAMSHRSFPHHTFYSALLFSWVLMIAALVPVSQMSLLQERVMDVLLGSAIGIAFSLFVFPVRPFAEFRQGILPVIRALMAFASEFDTADQAVLLERRQAIVNALQTQQGMYPEWVYEVGFNPRLRSGFRFFLVYLERITEIFFSMDYLLQSGLDKNLYHDLSSSIQAVMQKNLELLSVLLTYFSSGKLSKFNTDYIADVAALEEESKRLMPATLELLDVSPDYVKMTAFIRDVVDMRNMLLHLVATLPAN